MNWLIVKDGMVVNAVTWDGDDKWSPPKGAELFNAADHPGVWIGWSYDGAFHAPPEPEPEPE